MPGWRAAWKRLRSHGITRDPTDMTQAPDGPWYYQQIDLGFNYRMTSLQAALGLSQMNRLDAFVDQRHRVAAHYTEALVALPLSLPPVELDGRSAFHLYVVQVRGGYGRRTLFEALRAHDIGVNVPVPGLSAALLRRPRFPGGPLSLCGALLRGRNQSSYVSGTF